MQLVIYVLAFLFGGATGSFVLVIADRYHTGLSFWKGRSFCFSCGSKLYFKDLIPVFSYIFLKARCRYCGYKIPREALWVEIIAGLLSVVALINSNFYIALNQFGNVEQSIILYVLYLLIFSTVLLISIYDLRHFIIPDTFLVFLLILGLCLNLIEGFSVVYILSAIALCLPFGLLFLISRGRWLGFGDVKYIFVIGFLLGPAVGLSAVVLAFWVGAFISVFMILLVRVLPRFGLLGAGGGLTIKSEIPFGPFLSLGLILALVLHIDLFSLQVFIDTFY